MLKENLIPHPEGKTKVVFELVGADSNAYSLLGKFQRLARQQGFNSDWVQSIVSKCISKEYSNLISTLIDYTCDSTADSYPEPEMTDESPKDYQPSFWSGTNELCDELERLQKIFIPNAGLCIGVDGSVQVISQIMTYIMNFHYDLYNNGLCNDMEEPAQYVYDNFNVISPFFKNEEQEKEAKHIIKFYLDTKEEDENFRRNPPTCCNCNGDIYIPSEYEDEDDEICYDCDGGYVELVEKDFSEWFEEAGRMRTLDRLIEASIKCLLVNEEEVSPSYLTSELGCWEQMKWKSEQNEEN